MLRLLAATAEVRGSHRAAIGSLLERSDAPTVAGLLHRQRLVALLGGRLLELAPDFGGARFADGVASAAGEATERAKVIEVLAAHVRELLAARGISSLPLKGPFLARRLYGDPSLRSTNDLDLLVPVSRLDEAVATLAELGLKADRQPRDRDDIHRTLRHPRGRLPRVEVHWRLHWYESRFSEAMLARADTSGAWPTADPGDELAALLLFYARDGFYGLRTAADTAAWWDRYGPGDGAEPLLARHVRDYPQLRPALATAARVAERTVGVPAAAVVPTERPRTSERLAARLANWSQVGELDQLAANVALVNALLGSYETLTTVLRRDVWIPRAEIAAIYSLENPDGARARVWQLVHVPKIGVRFLLGLVGFRGTPPRRGRAELRAPA